MPIKADGSKAASWKKKCVCVCVHVRGQFLLLFGCNANKSDPLSMTKGSTGLVSVQAILLTFSVSISVCLQKIKTGSVNTMHCGDT